MTSPGGITGIRLIAFVAVQVIFLAGMLGLTAQAVQRQQAERQPPQFRTEPLKVIPLYNRPDIVSDADLVAVLDKLQPRFRGQAPHVNHLDHALRFWGVNAKFSDPQSLSGFEMRDILLDHRQFTQLSGKKTPAFLILTPKGVGVRLQEGEASASHVDHTLAGLAEVGTPLDYPVQTAQGEATVQAILEQSLADFSLNQLEYEWSALAYALYIPQPRWMTREGQQISYDLLADRIMRQGYVQGVCLGHHRLHALVMLLRIDEQTPILSDATRTRIHQHLRAATDLLVKNQKPEGNWDRDWAGTAAAADGEGSPTLVARTILATGHPLEWWALAPADVLPPPETLQKAAAWLVKTTRAMTQREVNLNYTFLSHAGRALALWRGKFPADVTLP